ncbi:hypothetical protein KM043_017412 [Ampulex compressa]|nr:hypothetical protein KM043_017412 [Ampulex compressa]
MKYRASSGPALDRIDANTRIRGTEDRPVTRFSCARGNRLLDEEEDVPGNVLPPVAPGESREKRGPRAGREGLELAKCVISRVILRKRNDAREAEGRERGGRGDVNEGETRGRSLRGCLGIPRGSSAENSLLLEFNSFMINLRAHKASYHCRIYGQVLREVPEAQRTVTDETREFCIAFAQEQLRESIIEAALKPCSTKARNSRVRARVSFHGIVSLWSSLLGKFAKHPLSQDAEKLFGGFKNLDRRTSSWRKG